jgi:CheY-like chemotaxis protein
MQTATFLRPAASGGVGARTVLLLEDDPLIRAATAEVLAVSGCLVIEAESAAEALACLNERHDIEVIVADVRLPGLVSGLEVCQLDIMVHPDLKIVFTSGSEMPDAPNVPPNSMFVPKPYRPNQIRAAVQA